MSKKFKITGEFDFEIEAETEQEAVWEAQDNLADLNNIRHEIEEIPNDQKNKVRHIYRYNDCRG